MTAILLLVAKALASLGGGGIVGLIGGVLKDRQAIAKAKVDNEHERAIRAQDIEMRRLDIEGNVRVEDRKAEAVGAQAANAALSASYQTDGRTYSRGLKLTGQWGRAMAAFLAFTDAARAWVRILITCAAAWFLYKINEFFFKSVLTPEVVAAQQARMLDLTEIVFLTTLSLIGMAIGWWYGSRGGIVRGKRAA